VNKVERLTAEILLLQERKRTSDELAGLMEVSRRTVIRDIRALCEIGVPVIALDGQGGGYSLPADYSISPLALTWKEAALLALALDGLARLADTPYSAERASLMAKLDAILPERHRERLNGLANHLTIEVPDRPQRADGLETLIEAARDGLAAEFRYRSSNGEINVRTVPERVYSARGFWYVLASFQGQTRTFRADRIEDLKTGPAEPGDVSPKAVPYDHPSHPLLRIRLSARGAARTEAEEHLGKLIQTRGPQEIAFRCPPSELDWFCRYFGSMGPDAVVLEPPELIDRIRAHAATIFEIYGPSSER